LSRYCRTWIRVARFRLIVSRYRKPGVRPTASGRSRANSPSRRLAKAAEILAERWTLLVLRELFLGSRHFNDFRRGIPQISPTTLSRRLQTLEAVGIVERVGGDRPPSTSTQTLRHHSRCCGIQLSKKAPLRGLSLRLPMGVGSSEPTCPNLQMRVS